MSLKKHIKKKVEFKPLVKLAEVEVKTGEEEEEIMFKSRCKLYRFDTNLKEWKDQIETKIQLKINRDLAIKEGTAMECACCFEHVCMDEMIACRDGHLFCQGCLGLYLTNSVFSNQSFGKNPKSGQENLELLNLQALLMPYSIHSTKYRKENMLILSKLEKA